MYRFRTLKLNLIVGVVTGLGSIANAQQTPVIKSKQTIDLPPAITSNAPTPPVLNPIDASKAATVPSTVMRYTLSEALRVGHEKHPSIRALNASLQAGLEKKKGLNEVHFLSGGLLPDLKTRKQQLDLGTQATLAELGQAEHEVTYAVIRSFYTVIYAREQAKVARELVDQLDLYLEQVRKIVNSKGGGVKGVNKDTEDKLVIVIAEAKGKLYEAESGVQRAKAALREAIGYGADVEVDTADEMLPEVQAEFSKDSIVNHALSRRGEIQLATIGAQVTQLEVVAQWSRRLAVRVPTFANGGDIHAKPVPVASREPEYKPGAVPPEMPAEIVGHRKTRTAIAQQYFERSEAVVEQAKNLVALEAEAAFARYTEAAKKVAIFKEGAKAGRSLVERQREATGGNLTKEDILMNEVSATKSFASFNQALYEQIVALANLERITSGGIRVNFPGR